nr:hypothetical protein [Tanacetum cinerariifolium]
MIKEKCYNIHQNLISVREKLDEGLSRFPDCKKLNKFREKFEENTIGIDNDDTNGIDKESDLPACQMESDSSASDDDNQKSDFQVLFHKESGNSDLQSMKNNERNEDVHHILNKDDKVDESCPATGVCSVIERDEVKFTEVEDVEKEEQQIGNDDDRVVDDSVTTIPDSITEGKEVKFIENDNVLVDDVHNEMIKCSFKAIVQDSVQRNDKVDDSCPATGVCFVIEGDEVKLTEVEDVEKETQQIGNEDDRVVNDSDTTIPDYVIEGKGVKFIENDNVLVDDVSNKMIKCSFEEQKSAKVAVDSQHTIKDIFKQDEQIQSPEG